MIQIGERVNDFELDAFVKNDIKKVKLYDSYGKWVVIFCYPGDFTFVCPTELEEVAKLEKEFEKLNAQVFGLSQDSAFVHKAWHESSKMIKGIGFPLLADVTAEVCKGLGAYSDLNKQPMRATFIIDPEMILRCVEINDGSIGRSIEETLRKLQSAVFLKENKGKVCQVNWTPGKEAIDLPQFTIFE